tara:strand:+ start:1544 stop:2302 length:759 start_codon:yes stop_codon:yes gene_type:complete
MLNYKDLTYYNGINDETKEYFEIWEHANKNPASADATQLELDEPDNWDYIMDNTCVPWVHVPEIDIPWKEIHKEAMHLLDTECFTTHRAVGSGGWMSLCIHGMSSVHTNCPEDYGMPDEAEHELSDWTDISKFCPITKEWMQDNMLYGNFSRVRFMCLLPGGWIMPHRDTDQLKKLGATNVAINNPDGCGLVMEEYGTMPFTPGSVFKINTGHFHSVWNRSDEPRMHMIFDGGPNDDFKRLVNKNYAKLFNI